MKRLIFIPLLIFSLTLSAQFTKSGGTFLKTGSGFMTAPTVPAEDLYCDKYDAVLAAYGTPPHDTIKIIQNALVYSLDTAGLLDRMDILYIHCNNNAANALINCSNPGTYNATLPEGYEPRLAVDSGFVGNSVSGLYVSSNFNASSGTHSYTLNSASIGVVILNTSLAQYESIYGANDWTNDTRFSSRTAGGEVYSSINTNDYAYAGNTYGYGHFLSTRTASNAGQVYRNGSSLSVSNVATSTAIPNTELVLLSNGSSNSDATIALFYVLDGITLADQTKLNTIVQTFLTDMNLDVIE
jgi:hypothetical protein